MIKYILKLIKKQRLLKKYKSQIDDNLFLLSHINNKNSIFYKDIQKHIIFLSKIYNRLKKL